MNFEVHFEANYQLHENLQRIEILYSPLSDFLWNASLKAWLTIYKDFSDSSRISLERNANPTARERAKFLLSKFINIVFKPINHNLQILI